MAGLILIRQSKQFPGGFTREKGSRFIFCCPSVFNESEIRTVLEGIRKEHHEPSSLLCLFCTGMMERYGRANDDSEPSRNSRTPILDRSDHSE